MKAELGVGRRWEKGMKVTAPPHLTVHLCSIGQSLDLVYSP